MTCIVGDAAIKKYVSMIRNESDEWHDDCNGTERRCQYCCRESKDEKSEICKGCGAPL